MVQSQPGSLKGLKALVAFLGILVVVGTAVVVGVVIRRLYAPAAAASNSPATPALAASPGQPWPPAAAALRLPADAKIDTLTATGGLLAISITTPQGDQLWLLQPATGARYLAVTSVP